MALRITFPGCDSLRNITDYISSGLQILLSNSSTRNGRIMMGRLHVQNKNARSYSSEVGGGTSCTGKCLSYISRIYTPCQASQLLLSHAILSAIPYNKVVSHVSRWCNYKWRSFRNCVFYKMTFTLIKTRQMQL